MQQGAAPSDPRITNPFYVPKSNEESLMIECAQAQRLVPDYEPEDPETQDLYRLILHYRKIGRPEVAEHLSTAYLVLKNWE